MNSILRSPSTSSLMTSIAMIYLVVAGGMLSSTTCLSAEARPNIVFILTDDQRDNTFSAMGHKWVKSPHVDKLLSLSTRFKNAYIAEPTCNPSRAALFLGCHERLNRLGFSSKHKMKSAQWEDSYPALLRKTNYKTGFVGKWHIGTDGFKFDSLFDYCEGHHGHGPFFFEGEGSEGSFKTTNRHHTDNALRFLDEVPADRPFCLSICYATPHGSKISKMHRQLDESSSNNPKLKHHPIYGGMYRELEIAHPLQNPQNPYDYIPKTVMDQDKGRNKTYRYDYDPAQNREHHFRYYQMITEIDQMVGEIVARLETNELSDDTIIIFGSDHGLLMGEYGMGGKGLLFDLTAKFPCFIYDPNAKGSARGQVREEIVSSLDVTATILDYAGVEKTGFMDGASLKPLVQSDREAPSWRGGLFLENLYTGRDTPSQEGYVEPGWKYIRFRKASHPYQESDLAQEGTKPVLEMLFDLRTDPGELTNLISSPELTETLNRLRGKCTDEVARLNRQREKYRQHYLDQ